MNIKSYFFIFAQWIFYFIHLIILDCESNKLEQFNVLDVE